MHARNTFAARQEVVPKSENVPAAEGNLRFQFPAASVTKIEIQL